MHDLHVQKIALFFFGNFGLTNGMRLYGTQSMKHKPLRLKALDQLGIAPTFYTKTKKSPISGDLAYPFIPDMILCFPDNEAIFIEFERSPRNTHDCSIIQSKLWALDSAGYRLWTLGNITPELFELLNSYESSTPHFYSEPSFSSEKTQNAIAVAKKTRRYREDIDYSQYDPEDLTWALTRGMISLSKEELFLNVAQNSDEQNEFMLGLHGLTTTLTPEHAAQIRLDVRLQ
jgi:hypothetical protein